MSRRWIDPSATPPPTDPPDNPWEVSAEGIDYQWRSVVADARRGSRDASRELFSQLQQFLRGDAFENAVYYCPEAREFLAERLDEAMTVTSNKVGKVLGLGLTKSRSRKSKYADLRERFREWYASRIRELGWTSKDMLPRHEVTAWITENSSPDESNVDPSTLDIWADEVRKQLFFEENFPPTSPSDDPHEN